MEGKWGRIKQEYQQLKTAAEQELMPSWSTPTPITQEQREAYAAQIAEEGQKAADRLTKEPESVKEKKQTKEELAAMRYDEG